MITFNEKLAEVVARDPRFAYEAYEFIYQALDYTVRKLGRGIEAHSRRGRDVEKANTETHVSGPQLLDGVRELALKEFGLMARTVFRQWGLRSSEDFGAIVFILVEADLMSKTDEDSLDDFKDGFDFDSELIEGYEIPLDEAR